MSSNVLRKGAFSTISSFYFNKRVDILLRIRSFAKRVRLHCKIHNQILYGKDQALLESNLLKLQNDDVDYFKISHFLLEDLSLKASFLSNRDSISILDLLIRIKKPLEIICSKTTSISDLLGDANTYDNTNSLEVSHGKQKSVEMGINRALLKGQKSLLKLLLDSEDKNTLSNVERYYLIIALSRESSLIGYSNWLKLFAKLDFVLFGLNNKGYKTFEVANLLLVYDQISRYFHKRYERKSKSKEAKTEGLIASNIETSTKDLTTVSGILNERRTSNPLRLDFINKALHRIEDHLDELGPAKIIKLLYLMNSRRSHSNYIFQKSLLSLESRDLIKGLKEGQFSSLFTLFSTAYSFQGLKFADLVTHSDTVPQLTEGSTFNPWMYAIDTSTRNRDQISENELTSGKESYTESNHGSLRSKMESLSLCVMILSLEQMRLFPDRSRLNVSELEGIFERIQETAGKESEWTDILGLLESRLKLLFESPSHSQGVPISNFSQRLQSIINLNKSILKLINDRPNHKFDEFSKTLELHSDFLTTVQSHLSNGPSNPFPNPDSFNKNTTTIRKLPESGISIPF